jgi:hypothetical protein
MAGLVPAIHVFDAARIQDVDAINSGLPEFRSIKRCKSGKPDLQ